MIQRVVLAPPVYAALRRLEEAGILHEATGRRRNKVYVYTDYLALLDADGGGAAMTSTR
jgi:hypothetical protein